MALIEDNGSEEDTSEKLPKDTISGDSGENDHRSNKESTKKESDSRDATAAAERRECWKRRCGVLVPLVVYVFSVVVYVLPMTRHGAASGQLDEMHIMSADNGDTGGTSPLSALLTNDYWGRNMNGASSHKSWRPLTVLSFRVFPHSLKLHRVVNVLIHAASAHIVGLLSTLLFPLTSGNGLLLQCLAQLLFALHPTHIECVVNAANRPHILALLFSILQLDPNISITLMALAQLSALLSCETAIFHLPAILLTITLIRYRHTHQRQRHWMHALISLLPRYLLLLIQPTFYLVMRHVLDWVSIPDGLIRPAENPFYALRGWKRIVNYSYILAIHIGKSVGLLDWIGFSHEYGYDCIPEIIRWDDRIILPLGMLCITCLSGWFCWNKKDEEGIVFMLWLVAIAWMASLFPISGIVKVGTFIADRIVVPSTVATCIFGARFLLWWLSSSSKNNKRPKRLFKYTVISVIMAYQWLKLDRRSLEWMDSVSLLESSLKTCPRSAKSNLEMSKVYSGLFPHKIHLERALLYLEMAEEIDPDYCDVHQQFAHVFFQQRRYLEFEERLTRGVLCPFSMSGSIALWQRYWQHVLSVSDSTTTFGTEAKVRHDKYSNIIQEAVRREQEKEDEATRNTVGRKDERSPWMEEL